MGATCRTIRLVVKDDLIACRTSKGIGFRFFHPFLGDDFYGLLGHRIVRMFPAELSVRSNLFSTF